MLELYITSFPFLFCKYVEEWRDVFVSENILDWDSGFFYGMLYGLLFIIVVFFKLQL